MTIEELKALLESATKSIADQKEVNKGLETKIEGLKSKLEGASNQETIDELKEQISDLRSKMKNPVSTVSEQSKDAMREMARKSFNTFVKDCKEKNYSAFDTFMRNDGAEQFKALNITNAEDGGDAVASILSMDLIEYARELSPILGEIGQREGLTRDYTELVLSKYPTIADGLENVAGTDFPVQDTQEYGTVKSDVIKVMGNAMITDEAFFGTTYNVYSDLVRLLGDEIGVKLAAKVLYGDGTGKNGRGILSSSRIDITDSTGESFKSSMGTDARNHDVFPVLPSGVSGQLGSDAEAIVDLMVEAHTTLPTKYLGKAKYHMNRKTKGVLEKLKNADLEPLFKFNFIEGMGIRLNGFPVVLDDTLPDIAADSTPIIFGDMSSAFAMSNGDIDYTQVNPYKTQGVRYVEHNKEIFTIMQHSDAIVVIACTASSGA